ncbi:MAG TPA: aminotransferase class V-fold PLP-dependent enzyme, partial [Thermomicrobiales bacterium]|nr:aminotransferase class V-fold PLP-dependent enzyme [Thermomicrobiales bacterium]
MYSIAARGRAPWRNRRRLGGEKVTARVAVEREIEQLREQLPAVHATGYFNAGTNGPLPRVAHEALVETATADLEFGRIVPGVYDRNGVRNRRVAAAFAEIAGVDEDEIALAHSTTEGIGCVLNGFAWQRGDEIVTTNLEHPGLLAPLALMARRAGTITRFANIGRGEGDVVGQIAAAMTPRTKMIALSHLQWSSGAVMPLAEIAALAREWHAFVLVDGAQSTGQIPLDLHAIGVDAYAMPGQKWLCGPEGTGAFYIRRDRMADVAPTYLRYADWQESGYLLPKPGAHRYEIGEFNGPTMAALDATLAWLRDEVGLDWAYARTAALGARFWDALAGIDGVQLLTPRRRMAGLVNFMVEGMAPQDVAAALFDRRMTIRYVVTHPCPASARASIAWWNTADEVDRLADAVADLVAESRARPE